MSLASIVQKKKDSFTYFGFNWIAAILSLKEVEQFGRHELYQAECVRVEVNLTDNQFDFPATHSIFENENEIAKKSYSITIIERQQT